jgi:hypothetical protein
MITRRQELRYSDVTPKDVYLNRRRFLDASAAAIAAFTAPHSASAAPTKLNAIKAPAQFNVTDKETPLATIAGYNNFYEFGTGKEDPSHNAPKWHVPDPWSVRIEGARADKPQTMDLTAIMKIAPLEERTYRHRCVDTWSIVVPWIGFSLSELLKQAVHNQPSQVRCVSELLRFESEAVLGLGRRPLSLRRGLSHRRSHASVGDAGSGPELCRIRTARPCAWWCRGSTASTASNLSTKSVWWRRILEKVTRSRAALVNVQSV